MKAYQELSRAELLSLKAKLEKEKKKYPSVAYEVAEKIQKRTGLDVRVFEDALTFKIAMMVADHMKYIR